MRASVSKKFFYTLFFGLYFLTTQLLFSQDKATRQSSLEAFSRGDYAAAYNGYSQLLASFPKDPVYKYYSGVSLVMLKKDPLKAETLLSEALSGSSLKALPADAFFYLGRAQQMNGKFSEAERSYRRFEQEAGKKKAKEMNVGEYISDSRAGVGAIRTTETENIPASPKIVVDEVKPITATPVVEKTYVSEEEDKKLGSIIGNQYYSDSLLRTGRTKDINPVVQKKAEPAGEITAPVTVINPETGNASDPGIALPGGDIQAKAAETKISEVKTVVQTTDAINTVPQSSRVQSAGNQPGPAGGVFSIFGIQENTLDKDVSLNPGIPEGLVYRIQIAVFRNPVAPSYFKGLTPIEGFRANGATVTIYYAGLFRRAEDARKALTGVKGKGFKDSFVVALMDGKTISAERASVYEKEWGSVPLYKFETEQVGNQLDTVPPTLHFRVEVARSIKPLVLADVESLKKLAGNRGLDVIQLNNGNIAYLIGNFITFESADDYADLLQRNGYRDARVVAWLGRKEIDVDTAKQLFENLQ